MWGWSLWVIWYRGWMTKRQHAVWERKRAHGRIFYTIVDGVLFFGSFYCLSIFFVTSFINQPHFNWRLFPVWVISGIFVGGLSGFFNWNMLEKAYMSEESSSTDLTLSNK
jgi:predicted membrane protein